MLNKIILKLKWYKDRVFIDFIVKLELRNRRNIQIKKGCFNQRTVFYGPGKIFINDNFSIGYRYGSGFRGRLSEIQARENDSEVIIGKNLAANNGVFICAKKKIVIGNDVLIGSNVTIIDHNAHGVAPSQRRNYSGTAREVIINDNVWLGSNVQILAGTTVGKNSIVGAGSVVKGNFPENCILEGNPAKIIKYIND